MKDKGLVRRYSLIMGALSVILIILWIGFYFLTVRITQGNMRQQVETWSESILSEVEEELLIIEDAAYELQHNTGIIEMTGIDDELLFYERGGILASGDALIARSLKNTYNAIVFNGNGLFYRLKGAVPNTLLNRAFYLMRSGTGRIITLQSNGSSYIGSYEPIDESRSDTGYVLILIEQDRIERLLSEYNDLDYINTALYSKESLLCANRPVREDEINKKLEEALFSKETEIGLSGFRMLIFCENTLSKTMAKYFRVIMPITVIILALVIFFFVGYIKRNMIVPINSELYESALKLKEAELENERTLISLLKKQINAHFTVNTLNVVRALINKGEKESAARICDELSTLVRYANAGDEFISLLEEFYVLEQYLGIMKVRYPGMIETDIDEDDSFADIYIPRMLIQPIVENAIVHGLAGEKGKITVNAVSNGEEVIISIGDNGRGMSGDELAELIYEINREDRDVSNDQVIQHIAMRNIQKRIRLVCGEEYGLKISSEKGRGTTVEVHLPAKVTGR